MVATPKPQLVKLALSSLGDQTFTTGSMARKATHYVVKIEIGGMAGLIAPLLGKQPQDTHVWIQGGEAPPSSSPKGRCFSAGRYGGSSRSARCSRAECAAVVSAGPEAFALRNRK